MKAFYVVPLTLLLFAACKQESIEQKIKSSLVERYKAENEKVGVKLQDVIIDSLGFKEIPIEEYFVSKKASILDTIKKYELFGRGSVVSDTLMSELSFQKMLNSLKRQINYIDAIINMHPAQKVYQLHYAAALRSLMKVEVRFGDELVYLDDFKPVDIRDDSIFLSQLKSGGK